MKKQLLASKNSPSGNIEVWQKNTVRYLYIQDKTAVQSQVDMAQKEKLQLQHNQAMMSFLLFQNKPESVLLFGLGGGSIIHFLTHWFPQLQITAVDIDEKVVEIAKQYFEIPETPQININIADAENYLAKNKINDINVIIVDLHDGKSLPEFLYKPDYIAQCFDALSSRGILVINMLVNSDQEFLAILTALRQSFIGTSFCLQFDNQKNILLFAFKSPQIPDITQLPEKAASCQKKYNIEFEQLLKNIVIVEAKVDVLM